jgi:hypothetical protein
MSESEFVLCFLRLISIFFLGSGLKFDSSGLYVPNPHSVTEKKNKYTDIHISSNRRRDSQLIFPRSEKEIFDIIGIPWVDPTLRNTDA